MYKIKERVSGKKKKYNGNDNDTHQESRMASSNLRVLFDHDNNNSFNDNGVSTM